MANDKDFQWRQAAGWLLCVGFLLPQVQDIFHRSGLRWLYILTLSFLLSLHLTPLAIKAAFHYGILDQPEHRKVHKNPTPRLGGLAIYLAFITSILANNILDHTVVVIMLAATMVVLISVFDDIRSLPAKLKLAVQLIACLFVYWYGIRISLFPVHGVGQITAMASQAGNFFLTFLWIVGITNAMNFIDGTDGLASGLGAVISMFLGTVAILTHQADLGWLALAMMGSCLGFLPYNFRNSGPALIFLGDTGSTFIGFTLACLAITGNWAEKSALVSICTPVLLFGVLIFDMTQTTISRIVTGKVRNFREWVSYVGQDHIHHRLYRLFQHNKKTVFFILGISSCLGISAIVLRQVDHFHSLLIVFQGFIAFVMFSAVNFYQEKALIKGHNTRSEFRVQESFDVTISLADQDKKLNGTVLDISHSGAKILVQKDIPLAVGTVVKIGISELDFGDQFLPAGTVIRTRDVIIDETQEGYLECGVKFQPGDSVTIMRLVDYLHEQQLKKHQEEIMRHLSPAPEQADAGHVPSR